MNNPLTTVELSLATPPVTKRQRLQRFANVIRSVRAFHSIFSSIWNTAMPANGTISRILVRHLRSQQKIASCTMLACPATVSVTRNGSSISPGRNWLNSHVYAVGR